jgi:hypothetical protein
MLANAERTIAINFLFFDNFKEHHFLWGLCCSIFSSLCSVLGIIVCYFVLFERSNRRKANKFKVLGAIKPKGLNRIAKKGIRAHMSEGVEP